MKTDTSERGLERLICTALTGSPCDPAAGPAKSVRERPALYGAGWIGGSPDDYDREYCVDLAQLSAFLQETQPQAAEGLDLGQDGPTRRKFLARLQGEITRRGTTCCGTGSSTGHITSTSSTVRPRRTTTGRRCYTRPTVSASPASFATAATRRSSPSTWASSSTACRSPPLS
ncbi:MAG: hypothetical protein USCGTAYLOR_00122 [Chromatiales bacterium USCg_Taylor]|nr:MAG: hypothetical protein USCGTAYLOR_00122 [Chromatiales bacterium USCg_Taylor]